MHASPGNKLSSVRLSNHWKIYQNFKAIETPFNLNKKVNWIDSSVQKKEPWSKICLDNSHAFG